jgi:pimeloyl-ACP methyl ester carboxylesterase
MCSSATATQERGGPREEGTYRDARAALLDRPGLDAGRVLYLGESLGGAVALALALGHRPRVIASWGEGLG